MECGLSGPDDQKKGTVESRAEAELRVEMESTITLLGDWIDTIRAETRQRNHAGLSADFENLLEAYERLCLFSRGLGAPNRTTRSMDELRDFRHELRTPLTVIMGYSKMLAQEAQDQGLGPIVDTCEKITQETRRLVAAAAVPLFRRFQSTGELQISQLAQLGLGEPMERGTLSRIPTDEIDKRFALLAINPADQRQALEQSFKDRSFVVSTANSGDAVLNLVELARFELLVMDEEMPDLRVEEVLQRLRGNVRTNALPVIVVQNEQNAERTQRYMDHGASLVLCAPIQEPELDAALGTLCPPRGT